MAITEAPTKSLVSLQVRQLLDQLGHALGTEGQTFHRDSDFDSSDLRFLMFYRDGKCAQLTLVLPQSAGDA